VFVSCSGDDNSGDDNNPTGGDHTYSISITDGILAGTSLSGSLPNEDFVGMYYDYDGTSVLSLTLGTVMTDAMVGGAVIMPNGGMTSTLNDEFNTDSGSST